jgi:hypothetical protein
MTSNLHITYTFESIIINLPVGIIAYASQAYIN